MKSFQFPLERVLAWCQTQQALAEAALARLLADHRGVQDARNRLQTNRAAAQGTIARAPATRGAELAELEIWRIWTGREDRRCSERLGELEKSIAEQKALVTAAARKVKMLEKLRTRRQDEWKAEWDHELETLTGEWAVMQWRRG